MGDSNLGTWTLNVAKSKYDPGPPPLVSQTEVYEAWETDGIKAATTFVLADGTHVTAGFSAHYDGKDCKVMGSPPPPHFDTVACNRVDANTTALTVKKGGTVVGTGKMVVSNDGKMRTVTYTGTNAKGEKAHNVVVFDKQ